MVATLTTTQSVLATSITHHPNMVLKTHIYLPTLKWVRKGEVIHLMAMGKLMGRQVLCISSLTLMVKLLFHHITQFHSTNLLWEIIIKLSSRSSRSLHA